MLPSKLYAAVAVFAVQAAAWSQSDNDCADNQLCLTSLVFCDRGGHGCDFREHEYSIQSDLDNRNTGFAVLYIGEEYNITWKNAVSNQPVNVSWTFGLSSGTPRGGYWSTLTNESYFIFRPSEIIKEFPNNVTNLTALEAQASASDIGNIISVFQAAVTTRGVGNTTVPIRYAQSSQFSLAGSWAIRAIVAQGELARQGQDKKWRLGVGIGVGLGVPILMIAAGLVGWSVGKKRARTTPRLKG